MRVTKQKVVDAFRNLGNGLELMEGLLQEGNISIDKEAILQLVKTGNEKVVKILLNNKYTGDMTSKEINLAATVNQPNSLAVIRLLLKRRNEISLTGDLVRVAKENTVSGKNFIQYLLSKDSKISEEAIVRLLILN